MPVQTDTPTGIGAIDDWGLWGSATDKLSAVRTNDGDTSVIYGVSGGRVTSQLFTFPTLVGVTDPVNSASMSCVAREVAPGGGARTFKLQWNSATMATNYGEELHVRRPDYMTCSDSTTSLALSAVNGDHGVYVTAAGGPSNAVEVWVTYLTRTVDFTYLVGSTGEFTYLIGSLAGALIGSGLLLREMPALSRCLGRFRLRPDEYEPAWREWTAFKHPAFGA